MPLDRITLADFRNHAATALDGTARFNLLLGENGAGKTNVLEALSLLAPGRGLRRAGLADLPRAGGAGGFAVSARLTPAPGDPAVQIGTGADAGQPGRRRVQVNGAPATALSLGEWLAMVWLTPAQDGLFTDSAGARRRFLDRMALARQPGHARAAARYEQGLRERNRLLAHDLAPDPAWLDAVEAPLAAAGAALAQGRAALVAALDAALARLPDGPFARPQLRYAPGGPVEEAALAATLRAERRRDRAAGRTLLGPQRDELEVVLAGKAMPAAHASTGEQKAMLIAITLAHAELVAAHDAQGRPLVLLLDEIAAHLDPVRRTALFDRLRATGAQVWMTGTEPAPFAPLLGEAAVWQIAAGVARREA